MSVRNPKQEGSNVFDCKPQSGPCPINCNQCFYNREGAFYVDIYKPHMPSPEEVGDGIMRVNSGHDSNIEREKVIKDTEIYPRRFFNTSIPNFDFPGPVVFTANPKEEKGFFGPPDEDIVNLMYVRLRVSSSNANFVLVAEAVREWTKVQVPVVLTFMAYYDGKPPNIEKYIWKQRHINNYWCAMDEFMASTLLAMQQYGGKLVFMCGSIKSNKCKDCRLCEAFYWQTIKRMEGK